MFLDLGNNFDSRITATLTLLLYSTTPCSVSLFPILLEMICRTLNLLSSQIRSVLNLVRGGDFWDGGAEQVSQVQYLNGIEWWGL